MKFSREFEIQLRRVFSDTWQAIGHDVLAAAPDTDNEQAIEACIDLAAVEVYGGDNAREVMEELRRCFTRYGYARSLKLIAKTVQIN
jgi:ppGpp synthetase/RelA/SpoT-type nucleotidyltranferase